MVLLWPALVVVASTVSGSGGLGPGAGPWHSGDPTEHGLSASKLAKGSEDIRTLLPERYCTVVVKDGEIVQESTYTNSSMTKYESDSAGKTIIAMLMGAVQYATGVDLDKPLASYGIQPIADTNWAPGARGAYFWPRVTGRHLLGQTSGFGLFEPGTVFTYDSDDYIQHLSLLIRHTTKTAPADWAEQHFAKPLGLSGLFEDDGSDGEISAGGGQFVSCRGLARVGQLYLNRGIWPSQNGLGPPQRLVSTQYIQQMGHPSFPAASANYGLLTWLPGAKPSNPLVQCCNSRFQCTNEELDEFLPLGSSMIGAAGEYESETPSGALGDELAMGLGWLGKWMVMIPSHNATVVTLGNTWGSTVACGLDLDGTGYDESFSVTVLWRQVREMLDLSVGVDPSRNTRVANANSGSTKGQQNDKVNVARFVLNNRTLPFRKSTAGARRTHQGLSSHLSVHALGPKPILARIAEAPSRRSGGPGVATTTVSSEDSKTSGSCQCLCPPDQGFGICVNATSAKQCEDSNLVRAATQSCPRVGIIKECQDLTPSYACPSTRIGSSLQGYFGLKDCHPQTGSAGQCGSQAGLRNSLDPLLESRTCSCGADRFMRPINESEIFPLNQGGCYWIPDQPCDPQSKYYPPEPMPPSSSPSAAHQCVVELSKRCGNQRWNVFNCATCAGQHQHQLQEASCTNTIISEWCAGVNPPASPPQH